MSKRDEQRASVLNGVLAGALSPADAAPLLGVSPRQARRLLAAYRTHGPRGIVHGNRGRRPAHARGEEQRLQIHALATGPYAGVNHSHLAELLEEREGIRVARSTLSDILRGYGIHSPRPQKRRSRHRSHRERYPQEGMLLQLDASHHDWLEGRGPKFVLMGAIDDATGKVLAARFHPTEDSRGYFLLMHELCQRWGVPQAVYSDKHSIFWPSTGESLAEQLQGRRSPTQFGRAMHELGIQMIPSHSPQSRGRIERLWGTLQDRLVAELRLAGVTSLEEANAFLPAFLARFNRRFAVRPKTPGSACRARLKPAQLDRVFCFKHERVVASDNTVRVGQAALQVLPGPNRAGYARAVVTVHESLDAHFAVFYQGKALPSRPITLRDRIQTAKRASTPPSSSTPSRPKPPPTPKPRTDHPWRKYPAVTKSPGN